MQWTNVHSESAKLEIVEQTKCNGEKTPLNEARGASEKKLKYK